MKYFLTFSSNNADEKRLKSSFGSSDNGLPIFCGKKSKNKFKFLFFFS
jgi:hypothetical protein